uniref:Uncharacterized protein n=1 Tax=Arundo donax TaxID=35708 RepID=A0A0A9HJF8_ARUDO
MLCMKRGTHLTPSTTNFQYTLYFVFGLNTSMVKV